ncbi:hypothetical protein M0802_015471 [Mischocyttarus mexicanus]|nr:hypothetical protein M0802_015471 [Mischocyttarus mexicanus]
MQMGFQQQQQQHQQPR